MLVDCANACCEDAAPRALNRDVDDTAKEFGQRLQKVRRESGETQLTLAVLLEVDPSQVSRWERGLQEPGGSELRKLLWHYRHAHEFLLFGEGDPPESPAFAQFRETDIGQLADAHGLLPAIRGIPLAGAPTAAAYRRIALALLAAENGGHSQNG